MKLSELSASVSDAASKVYNELGPFLSPSIYRSCMVMELRGMGARVKSQVFIPVFYRGKKVKGEGFEIDLLVEKEVFVEIRLKRMADAIGFLASWHLTGSRDFHLMVQSATGSERSFIESNLGRFDKEIFVKLGKDLHNLAADPYQASRTGSLHFIVRHDGFVSSGEGAPHP